MGFDEAKRAPMRLLSFDHKWRMITSSKINLERLSLDSNIKTTAEHFIKELSNVKSVSLKTLQSLKVSLSAQPVSWVEQFSKQGGLNLLVEILNSFRVKNSQ